MVKPTQDIAAETPKRQPFDENQAENVSAARQALVDAYAALGRMDSPQLTQSVRGVVGKAQADVEELMREHDMDVPGTAPA